jgi:hypothetical protein
MLSKKAPRSPLLCAIRRQRDTDGNPPRRNTAGAVAKVEPVTVDVMFFEVQTAHQMPDSAPVQARKSERCHYRSPSSHYGKLRDVD